MFLWICFLQLYTSSDRIRKLLQINHLLLSKKKAEFIDYKKKLQEKVQICGRTVSVFSRGVFNSPP